MRHDLTKFPKLYAEAVSGGITPTMQPRSQLVRFAALALIVLLTGCHKRVKVATPPLPPLVVPEVPMSMPAPPPEMSAPTPAPPVDVTPTPAPAPETRTSPRRATTRPAPAPTPKPAAPAEPNLGQLSESGTTDGGSRVQAQVLIGDMDKRILTLSSTTRQQKSRQLAQVQLFLKQAKDALSSGDPVGASNLATKSKLLLDDLMR